MSHSQPTRRRSPRLAWLTAAAIIAALTLAASAAAAPVDSTGPEPDEEHIDAEERVDAAVASYAADYDVTYQEAQRRLDRIQPLQEILASIRDLEGARLAGWGIDHQGAFTGWVWLTGDQPPSTEAARIADTHSDVQIRTGADHSLAELLAAQTGLFGNTGTVGHTTSGAIGHTTGGSNGLGTAGGPSGPDATGHTTGGPDAIELIQQIVTYTDTDMGSNAVRIGIDPALADPPRPADPEPIATADETLQDKITEVTQVLTDHIDVAYTVEDGRGAGNNANFAGGEPMSDCTSGFAARRRPAGPYGIITAGHCRDDLSMHGIALDHYSGFNHVGVDAQFHTIPSGSMHQLLDDFTCGGWWSDRCDVTGDVARSDMPGDHICHYGRRSGISCGTVTSINFQPNHNRACIGSNGEDLQCLAVFVEVQGPSLRACDGDSGGPWYRGGTAYGIHMGSTGPDICTATVTNAFFSAIRDVELFLRAAIITDGPVVID